VFAPLHSVWGGGAQSRAFDDTWEDGDEVGIYMINNGASSLNGAIYTNKLYTIDATGALVPAGDPMEYPQDGSEVNFVAYYPYRAGSITEVDVADQSSLKDIDLMIGVSKAPPYGLNKGKVVELEFEHKLSKLVITATPETDSGLDMTDATLSITGMPTTANCVLHPWELKDLVVDPDNPIVAWRENKDAEDNEEKAVWKAIIIPHTAPSDDSKRTFEIEVDGGIYIYELVGPFDPGNVYEYTFTLTTE
jgi:hypothetical protein